MIDFDSYLDKVKKAAESTSLTNISSQNLLLIDNSNVNKQIRRKITSRSNISSKKNPDSCLEICLTACKYSFLKWIVLVLFIVFLFQLITGINCYAIIKKQYSKSNTYHSRVQLSIQENLPTQTPYAPLASSTQLSNLFIKTISKVTAREFFGLKLNHKIRVKNENVVNETKTPNNFTRLIDVEKEKNEYDEHWKRAYDAETKFRSTFTELKRAFINILEEKRYEYCDLPDLRGPLNLTFNFTDFNSSRILELYQYYYQNSIIEREYNERSFDNITVDENFMIIEPTISADVKLGGVWQPRFCHQEHKVIIIIPYRNRFSHLAALLPLLHSILQRQLIDYRIIVTEQFGNDTFNKGRIMNAAYLEAKKLFPDSKCVIFHDVDLLPEDDRLMYTCPNKPRHLSVAIDKFNYILPYYDLVGGVFAISDEHFKLVNGYSVSYFGWGGEDDDLATRISLRKLPITRPRHEIARFKMVRHTDQTLNPNRHLNLRRTKIRFQKDGLNTVQYRIISVTHYFAFTHFFFDIGKA